MLTPEEIWPIIAVVDATGFRYVTEPVVADICALIAAQRIESHRGVRILEPGRDGPGNHRRSPFRPGSPARQTPRPGESVLPRSLLRGGPCKVGHPAGRRAANSPKKAKGRYRYRLLPSKPQLLPVPSEIHGQAGQARPSERRHAPAIPNMKMNPSASASVSVSTRPSPFAPDTDTDPEATIASY